jgi:hypothetical protein
MKTGGCMAYPFRGAVPRLPHREFRRDGAVVSCWSQGVLAVEGEFLSLRRHDPDQVQRVFRGGGAKPAGGFSAPSWELPSELI